MIAGAAAQKFMMQLAKEQEIIMNVSDMIIDLYAAESVLLRVEKLTGNSSEGDSSLHRDILSVFINDCADRVFMAGKNGINAMADGDEHRMMMMGLKRFTKTQAFNQKEARRRIAAKLIAENSYAF
jgi:hypothetical protein